jgi:hypothetical protein
MKKIAIVIMVLFTIGLAGGLYNTFAHLNDVGQEVINQAYVEQLPPGMPDMAFNPVSVIPLY